jgi:hypothetical protein
MIASTEARPLPVRGERVGVRGIRCFDTFIYTLTPDPSPYQGEGRFDVQTTKPFAQR